MYESLHNINPNGSYNQTTIVDHITPVLIKNGLKNISSIQVVDGIFIYPKEYFCPLDSITKKLDITPNTRTIHHYTASWYTRKHHLYRFVSRFLGNRMSHQISFFEFFMAMFLLRERPLSVVEIIRIIASFSICIKSLQSH